MLRIAIVEDERSSAEILRSYFQRYEAENGTKFHITEFPNAVAFLSKYRSGFDIVCMDIAMPHMNGMEAARKLRKIDDQVVLIFITNLSQYAIAGYEVNAMNYVLKPLKYPAFKLSIMRAVAYCEKNTKKEVELVLKEGQIRIAVSSIKYVEIHDHDIIYHTDTGNYSRYGTMKKVEESLPSDRFFRCNSCYLVNLGAVTKIESNAVWVGDEKLLMSRPRRKAFMEALHEYYAETPNEDSK